MGGEGLHPLAIRWTSLLWLQASARAPWGPPQLAHLVIPCAHWLPLPTLHPSTGHLWSVVLWSFEQRAHLGPGREGRCAPTHCTNCRKHLVDQPPRRRQPHTGVQAVGHYSCKGGRKPPLPARRSQPKRSRSARTDAGPGLHPTQSPDLGRDLDPAILSLKLLSELVQTIAPRASHAPRHRDVVDSDPPPTLLGDGIPNAAVHRMGRPENRVAMLGEVLQ